MESLYDTQTPGFMLILALVLTCFRLLSRFRWLEMQTERSAMCIEYED